MGQEGQGRRGGGTLSLALRLEGRRAKVGRRLQSWERPGDGFSWSLRGAWPCPCLGAGLVTPIFQT